MYSLVESSSTSIHSVVVFIKMVFGGGGVVFFGFWVSGWCHISDKIYFSVFSITVPLIHTVLNLGITCIHTIKLSDNPPG